MLNPSPETEEALLAGIITFLQPLGHLRKMELRTWKYDSSMPLRAIVCACRHLVELELRGIWDVDVSPKPIYPTNPTPLLCLQTIKAATYAPGAHLFPWLLSLLGSSVAITTLHLSIQTFVGDPPQPSCELILNAVASSLEHLTIANGNRFAFTEGARCSTSSQYFNLIKPASSTFTQGYRFGSPCPVEDTDAQ